MIENLKKILVLTVGGSATPVINAYKEFEPDYVYFIASRGRVPDGSEDTVDGPGDPCGDPRVKRCPNCNTNVPMGNPEGKAIVYQAGIPPGTYEKRVIEDPDSLEEVYELLEEIDSEIKERFPGARKAINYTCGTKNMTAGAVLFGTNHPEWELAFQHGPRRDLNIVYSGDQWRTVNVFSIYAKGQYSIYADLLNKYHYGTVDWLIKGIQQNGTILPKEFLNKITRLRSCCQAFDAWDRFDHATALSLLDGVGGKRLAKWIVLAKKLTGQIRDADPYLKITDLIANSERRYTQGRYDDAVGRLYRALEWLAQIRLSTKYNIDTNDIDLELLPGKLKEQFAPGGDRKGKIRTDLVKDYRLLETLGDELGYLWQNNQRQLIGKLELRNYSILAHGQKPVSELEYREFRETIVTFIEEGLKICGSKAKVEQLPTKELLDV